MKNTNKNLKNSKKSVNQNDTGKIGDEDMDKQTIIQKNHLQAWKMNRS